MLRTYFHIRKVSRAGDPRREFRGALLGRLYAIQGTPERARPRVPAWVTAFAVLALIFMSTGAYAYESPMVVEGHPLYVVKRKMESARVRMVRTPEGRAEVHLWKMQRRMREADHTSTASLRKARTEFGDSLNVIRTLPQERRSKLIRESLRRRDRKHLQTLTGMAVREPEKLEVVGQVLQAEQAKLEEMLREVQDPQAARVLERHLRVREALLDAIESTQLEDSIEF